MYSNLDWPMREENDYIIKLAGGVIVIGQSGLIISVKLLIYKV